MFVILPEQFIDISIMNKSFIIFQQGAIGICQMHFSMEIVLLYAPLMEAQVSYQILGVLTFLLQEQIRH